jgi:hypothetical protein
MADNSFIGWVGGIVAAVLIAVLIWQTTHPEGWIYTGKPPTPTPTPVPAVPHVEFLSCNGYSTWVGITPSGSFDIINNGTGIAHQCRIKWFPGPKAGTKQVLSGHEPESAKSDYFGLLANERRTIPMSGLSYTDTGTYMSYAHVECDGSNVIVNACSLPIPVNPNNNPSLTVLGDVIKYNT